MGREYARLEVVAGRGWARDKLKQVEGGSSQLYGVDRRDSADTGRNQSEVVSRYREIAVRERHWEGADIRKGAVRVRNR